MISDLPASLEMARFIAKDHARLMLSVMDSRFESCSGSSHLGSVNCADRALVSAESESFTQEWPRYDCTGYVLQGFDGYRYFTVSTLGDQPARDGRRFQDVDSLRVEDPFLWLQAKPNLVPVTKGR